MALRHVPQVSSETGWSSLSTAQNSLSVPWALQLPRPAAAWFLSYTSSSHIRLSHLEATSAYTWEVLSISDILQLMPCLFSCSPYLPPSSAPVHIYKLTRFSPGLQNIKRTTQQNSTSPTCKMEPSVPCSSAQTT